MVLIGSKRLSLEEFTRVVFEGEKIELETLALKKAERSYSFLKEFSRNSIIYGVNTGLGPMAQYRISEEDQHQLQYNLIRSHSSGAGSPLPTLQVRALMLCRLNSLMQGYSALHTEILFLLRDFINLGVYPVVFEKGGVGASGDLVQLAHLALALIGEGDAYFNSERRPVKEILSELNLKPSAIYIREGLGVMNGTSAMTGIGLTNLVLSKKLLNIAVFNSCLINEIAESYDDHFSKELNQVKLHGGQQKVAAAMRAIVADSNLIRKRQEHLYNKEIKDEIFADKVQEYYSLRCVPQILGPVSDTLKQVEQVLIDEVNSANDNPVIDADNQDIYHGGNFHGDYVSLEMDKLKIAVTKLSMLAERQLNFIMNRNLNGKLPPFANLGKLGFNFGMQGVQFTATSTVAENQTLAFPMYLHSIPNNNDNQDIVSMGTNAALICKRVIDNTFDVMSIHTMALLQAVDYLEFKERLSSQTRERYSELRSVFPVFVDDFPKYFDIQQVKQYLLGNHWDFL